MTDFSHNEMENKIITFGCRLNACESEIIYDFAKELGLEDITIINTCAVTAEAERKLRQTIRKLYNENNDIKIILTGCASELNPDSYIKMDGIVGIISNKMKLSKDEYACLKLDQITTSVVETESTLQAQLAYPSASSKAVNGSSVTLTETKSIGVSTYAANTETENGSTVTLALATYKGRVRGFLQVQNGCDQKCTYCVVRFTRGPSVSFPKDDIVSQTKKLLQRGYKEIVLTGVNVSSYGRSSGTGDTLSSLIRYMLKNVPDLRRLGLSSLDPADIDDELINVISGEERLLPHIHESIQAGDDMILKRMLRRHSAAQVVEINEKILSRRPEVVLGADMMVGFPTETDEMFENTKLLMEKAHISLLHSFPYSPRPGTPACGMPMVEKKIRLARAAELRKLSQGLLTKKMQEFIGKNVVILAESEYAAKTNSFLQVKSRKKLVAGSEYLFHCEDCEKKHIIGYPIEINEG
ncbi:tRNA (N(6)-L-threonylcarbamoyladenosine(37)-C(2))-methylthiotransferase MtaB [Alphaproteobacteria bacterium]|nr:tRNA (N(6)-L-threonylcarbamoyladenosine(37)-C(2))-methylthiotransferase MtaB [Alphaproteobacteria bacterium]